MGLLLVHHVEIVRPLEVIEDILAGLIKNLNAGDVSITIFLGLQSEHVAACIREGLVHKVKAVLLEAGGDFAQTLAGAGTGLNGLVQGGFKELLCAEAFKLINRVAIRSIADRYTRGNRA